MNDHRKNWPTGTRVKLLEDDGTITKTCTRSVPWQLGDGTWVVKVRGKTGGYMQDRMTPVDRDGCEIDPCAAVAKEGTV